MEGNVFVIHNIAFLLGKKNQCLYHLTIHRTSVSKEKWEKFEGTFSLSTMPDRAVFYFEGPPPEIDLLVKSVAIVCSCPSEVIYDLSIFFLLGLLSIEDFGKKLGCMELLMI